jgi:hypothetical protein
MNSLLQLMQIYALNYVQSYQDFPAPFYVQEHQHPKLDVQKENRGKLY